VLSLPTRGNSATPSSSLQVRANYHGHAGVECFFRDWLATWADYAITTREYRDAGDAVVVVFRQSGAGQGSGVRVERDFFTVYDLRESKVVRARLYESRDQALEAAGLRE